MLAVLVLPLPRKQLSRGRPRNATLGKQPLDGTRSQCDAIPLQTLSPCPLHELPQAIHMTMQLEVATATAQARPMALPSAVRPVLVHPYRCREQKLRLILGDRRLGEGSAQDGFPRIVLVLRRGRRR